MVWPSGDQSGDCTLTASFVSRVDLLRVQVHDVQLEVEVGVGVGGEGQALAVGRDARLALGELGVGQLLDRAALGGDAVQVAALVAAVVGGENEPVAVGRPADVGDVLVQVGQLRRPAALPRGPSTAPAPR